VPAPDPDVAVIGGGIAGLTAAHRLAAAGVEVVVLEAADRPGGRIHTVGYGPLYAEAGASVVTAEETATLELLGELGIDALEELGPHGVELFVGGRRVTLSRLDGRLGGWRDVAGLVRLYRALRATGLPRRRLWRLLGAQRRAMDEIARLAATIEEPYHPAATPRLDEGSFGAFLARFDPGLGELFDLGLRVTAGAPSDRISLFWGLVTFHWNLDGSFYWLRGGTSVLPEALAAGLGERLRLAAPAAEVIAGEPVEVRYHSGGQPRRLRARAVVVAATPEAAAALVPGLPAWKRRALGAVRFGAYLLVHLRFARRFWAAGIRSGYMNCAGVVFADLVDGTRGQAGDEGILVAFLAGSDARRCLELGDDEVLAVVLADLDKVFPGHGGGLLEARVFRWPRGIPYFPPGYGPTLEALRRPVGNLYFCGDYTEGAGVHDAVVSGERAAGEVLAALEAGPTTAPPAAG
jgi:protoporphyrinogen oxidase